MIQLITEAGVTLTQEQIDKLKAVEDGHAIKKRKHEDDAPSQPPGLGQVAHPPQGQACHHLYSLLELVAQGSCQADCQGVAAVNDSPQQACAAPGRGSRLESAFEEATTRPLPNLCSDIVPSGPSLTFAGVSAKEAAVLSLDASRLCWRCKSCRPLGYHPNPEVQGFLCACQKVYSNQPCDELLTAVNDVLHYCPLCLSRWSRLCQSKKGSSPIKASAATCGSSSAPAVSGSRRTRPRRRHNRRMRLAALTIERRTANVNDGAETAGVHLAIEPLRGAPRTQAEEGF